MGCVASLAPDPSPEFATKATCGDEEEFVLETSPEVPVGMKFSVASGHLLVRLVQGGAIEAWNAKHKARQVGAGSEILCVNGESKDLAKMLMLLHEVGRMKLRVRRAAPPGGSGGADERQRPAPEAHSPPQTPSKTKKLVELPFVSAANLEDATCCICLETMAQDMRVLKLPCKHHFHLDCGAQWLRQKGTCPLCVRPLIRPDGQPWCCAARGARTA